MKINKVHAAIDLVLLVIGLLLIAWHAGCWVAFGAFLIVWSRA